MLDFRFLGRHKTVAGIAIVTIALAIGANTAVLAVLDALLRSSIGVPDADRVVVVAPERNLPGRGSVVFSDAYPNYQLLRATQHVFADVSVFLQLRSSWDDGGEMRPLAATRATASFFSTLRVHPAIGRTFGANEEGPSPARVVVISHALWVSSFGSDAGIVGRQMSLDGAPHTVIGVMPAGFSQPLPNDVWLPFDIPESQRTSITGARQLTIYARLADGISMETARRGIDEFTTRAVQANPVDNGDYRYNATSLRTVLLAGADASALFVQAGAAMLLLLATLNLASLFLAWGFERSPEMAVRHALGATDRGLARLLIQQSFVVVAAGAALGVGLAFIALRLLQRFDLGPTIGAFIGQARIGAAMVVATTSIAAATAVIAGALPAWFSRAAALGHSLRLSSRSATLSRPAMRWQQGIVIGQTALCTAVVAAAVVTAFGFWRLSHVPDGFAPSRRVVGHVVLPDATYGTHTARAALGQRLTQHFAGEPSIAASGFTTTLPVGDDLWGGRFLIELPDGSRAKEPALFHIRRISPDYLEAIGIPLMSGRSFTSADDSGAVSVAIVSRALASRLWPNETALGKRLLRVVAGSATPTPLTVVGVAGNVMDAGYSAPAGEAVYVPYSQISATRLSVVAVTRGNDAATLAALGRAIRATDATLAVSGTSTLGALVRQANELPRLRALVLTLFSLIAAAIVALGTYGVMAQLVSTRERELALRLAFGAVPRQIGTAVLAQSTRLTVPGVALGIAFAWIAGGFIDRFVFGVSARSPAFLAVVGAGLLLLAGLAALPPALRAMRIDVRRGVAGGT